MKERLIRTGQNGLDSIKYDGDCQVRGEFRDCVSYCCTASEGVAQDMPQHEHKDGADHRDDGRAQRYYHNRKCR